MSEKELCGCDDSKKWKARAFSSDLALKLVRQQLTRLLERVDAALCGPGEVIDSEFAEVDEPQEGAFTELTDEGERRVPGEYRKDVLASGRADAGDGAFLHVPTHESLVADLFQIGLKHVEALEGERLDPNEFDGSARRAALLAEATGVAERARRGFSWRETIERMASLVPSRSKSERP